MLANLEIGSAKCLSNSIASSNEEALLEINKGCDLLVCLYLLTNASLSQSKKTTVKLIQSKLLNNLIAFRASSRLTAIATL